MLEAPQEISFFTDEASEISNDITNFNHLLTPAEDTAQKAFDRIDDRTFDRTAGDTAASITVNDLTASLLVATDASKKLVSVADLTAWVAGTGNQVIVANDGDGSITLSTPQDIAAASSPQFVGLTLTGNFVLADTTTSALGVVTKGAVPFLHNYHNPTGGGAVPVGDNTFLGENAGNFTTGETATEIWYGSYLAAFGTDVLSANTIGYSNSAFGSGALKVNTIGYRNVAVGTNALSLTATGYQNVAVGSYVLAANIDGIRNTACGDGALQWCTSADYNSAFGMGALGAFAQSGDDNAAFGMSALIANSTGYGNVAVGRSAMYNNTTGYANIAVGYRAGRFIANGSGANATSFESVYLGGATKSSADGIQDEIVIGYGAIGQGIHTAVLGHTSITDTYLRGTVHGVGITLTGNIIMPEDGTIGITGPAEQIVFNGSDDTIAFMSTKVGIGTLTSSHGGVGGSMLAIDGANASIDGPHIQLTTDSDDYPLFSLVMYTHDAVTMLWDAYWNGTSYYSSDAGSNFQIQKVSNTLKFAAESGIAQGAVATFVTAFEIEADGEIMHSPGAALKTYWRDPQINIASLNDSFLDLTADGGTRINTGDLQLQAGVTLDFGTQAPGAGVVHDYWSGAGATGGWPFYASTIYDGAFVDQYITFNKRLSGGTRAAPTFTGNIGTGLRGTSSGALGAPVGTLEIFHTASGAGVSPTVVAAFTSGLSYFNGSVGIGTPTVPHVGVGAAKLAIEGANASTAGPHMQFTTVSDNYPLLQFWAWQHDIVALHFDAYHDGAYRSSDAGSNFQILKNNDVLYFNAEAGIAAGNVATFVTAFYIESDAEVLYSPGAARWFNVRDAAIGFASLNNGYLDIKADLGVRIGAAGGVTNYSAFEADGTLAFHGAATVWKDINLATGYLQTPASSAPGIVTFTDNLGADTDIATRGFAAGEKLGGTFELQHDYKEGSSFYWHIHFQCDAAPSGTDYVKWQIDYTITRDGVTMAPVTPIVIEVAVDTQYEQIRADWAISSGAGLLIGDQVSFKLSRIVAAGDAYAGEAKLKTVGIHYEVDTVGSRTTYTK